MISKGEDDDGNNRKRKRTTKEEEAPPQAQPNTALACSRCLLEFTSRNQLFRHLRTSNKCSLGNGKQKEAVGEEDLSQQLVKVILLVAYLGRAYHGSARNDSRDSVPTVEGRLWEAIARALSDRTNDGNDTAAAGSITTTTTSSSSSSSFARQIERHTNPKAMTRSSRTDKGVSSLGNIYSLLLPDVAYEDEASFASGINRHLPDDIRLLRIHVANNDKNDGSNIPMSFNARTCCEARRYRYLVPTRALFRRGEGEGDGGPAMESIMDLRKRMKQVLLQWGGTHSFHNFTNWKESSSETQDRGQNRQNEGQQKVQHDDHGDDAKDATSHFRHILRCHVEDVIQNNARDFLVISIKGQSFLYHQIRKMMGASIGVMNGSLPPDFISRALKKRDDRDVADDDGHCAVAHAVPLAPAEGLVLVESIYSKYCSKHNMEPIGLGTKVLSRGSGGGGDAVPGSSDWEGAAAELAKDTRLFQERVYAQIFRDQELNFSLS